MFKKNLIYFTVIIFSIAKEISKLLLFAIPIKSIKIIDRSEIIPEINTLLKVFNINVVSNRHQFIFLSLVFIFLILGIYIINIIRSKLIKKIKLATLDKIFKSNEEKPSQEFLEKKLKTIDEFINFRTTLIYSLILIVFVIFYDYQIALILIFNCFLNYKLTTKINYFYTAKKEETKFISNENYISRIKNEIDINSFINPAINTFTMFCIMTSVFLRKDISVSFIFIFLIRIYQRKINNLIIKITENEKFKSSIIKKLRIKNYS